MQWAASSDSTLPRTAAEKPKRSSRSVPIAYRWQFNHRSNFLCRLGIRNLSRVWVLTFSPAANYLANCGCSKIALPIPPSVNSLFTILSQNGVTEILGALAFGLAWIWLISALISFRSCETCSAWSFDRVGPERLADVNPRFVNPCERQLS